MERRDFLQMCSLAAMGSGAKPSAGLGSPSPLAAFPERSLRLIPADQVHTYSLGHGQGQIIVDTELSGGSWWMGQFREGPGFMTTVHVHTLADEHFFVLDGVLSLYVGGEWQDVKSGEFALVPRGVPHAQGNTSSEPAHFLGSGNPAGFERFFPLNEALLKRMSPSDPNYPGELAKIFAQVATRIVAPPPQRRS